MADIVSMLEFWSPVFDVVIDEGASAPQASINFALPPGAVVLRVQQLISIASLSDNVTAVFRDVDAANATLEFQGGLVGQVAGISQVGGWLTVGTDTETGSAKFYGDQNPTTVIEALSGVLISRWINVLITAGIPLEDLRCRGMQHGVRIWFTQTIAGVTDWTAGEKEQIRQAVGITGTKSATAGGNLDDVLADTDEIQGKLPSKATLRGTADADGGFDTEDKADINAEADQALVDYDPPTKAELDTAEANIISEIDDNETKIDTVITDLGTHDTDIKALIGTPSVDISADIAANLAAIQAIQNNTRFTAAVPNPMQKPDAGNQAYRHASNLYDTQGDMEDPDNSEILVRIIKNDGTFITANLFKENALSNGLDDPTDTGTFPPASGWRAMEKEATGKYFFFYKVASTETEEPLTVEFGWNEAGQVNYQSRPTKISDTTGDIEAILTAVIAIGVKVDSGTPSPTIPAQITTHDTDIKADIATHDTDIKALPTVKATPEYLVVPSGNTRIEQEGGIDAVVTTIPVYDVSTLQTEGAILFESEYITYTGISVGNELTGCTRGAYGSTPATHADHVQGYEVLVYPIRLMVYDNELNMVAPDSAPTIEIVDWNGNQELAPLEMTLISTGLYGYNYKVAATDTPEPKTLRFSITTNSITTLRQSTLMLNDEPASQVDLLQIVGGGTGEFVCNQDGYFDSSNIFQAWTDVMVGYLRDATDGSRLDDVLVTAYKVINGQTVVAKIPPGQTVCDDNGNYELRLDAGTYTFKFHKDQYRFPTDEVPRTVTP